MLAQSDELLLAVAHDAIAGYRHVLPNQAVNSVAVIYQPVTGAVLEIHSHHRLPARFSPIDDADEQRLCLYSVLGRLDRDRPEVALRVGVYGHFLPVPWESVFSGDRGSFREVIVPTTEEDESDVDLSDCPESRRRWDSGRALRA